MDLPIIFADDESLLATDPHTLDEQHQPMVVAQKKSPANKLVVINKQQIVTPSSSSSNIQHHPNTLKRPAPSTSARTISQPMKFAKIIVSKRSSEEAKTQQQQQMLSSNQQRLKQQSDTPQITTISPKKYDSSTSFENFDLETELKATAVPKPMHSGMLNKSEIKQLLSGSKKSADGKMRNLTLRVPVTFNRSSNPAVPSRFVYADTGSSTGDNVVVLNRTIAHNKHSIVYEDEDDDD